MITIQPRLTLFGPHIDHDVYMSAKHVSPDLDLIFMVYQGLNFPPNLTSPGLFNDDISLSQKVKVLAQISIAKSLYHISIVDNSS